MNRDKITNRGLQARKQAICYLIIVTCSLLSVHAQERRRQDFFVGAFGEAVGYGYDGPAYGGGLIIGAGTGGALGLRVLYAQDGDNISFLEINALARLYIFGRNAIFGPFVQLDAGPVIYFDSDIDRTGYGNVSAGLTTGWRFLPGKRFYIEPTVRMGYPYLIGGGLSVGVRFGP